MRSTRLLAVGLALVIVASGCASDPSLKGAAAELQKDMQRLEADDVFKSPSKKLRILQRPDKDIPCDKEKFKRVLRATADYERKGSDVDGHLDLAQGLMENTLVQVLGYKLDFDFSQTDAEDGRFIYGTKGDSELRVTVYVAPDSPTWRLHAMTACLSR
ncbi:hypothetical protein ACFY3V_25975 [Streptosporangium sp. NPDC000095]|uniref:hypothetical protein n=1 Tax=Streptosporangium sp. NPDC000095 TaxID=3366184 RepID=UPI0036798706